MAEFELRLSLLKQLRDIWATGGTAVLEAVPSQASGEFGIPITISILLTRREVGLFYWLSYRRRSILELLCLCCSDVAVVCGARCGQYGLNWKTN